MKCAERQFTRETCKWNMKLPTDVHQPEHRYAFVYFHLLDKLYLIPISNGMIVPDKRTKQQQQQRRQQHQQHQQKVPSSGFFRLRIKTSDTKRNPNKMKWNMLFIPISLPAQEMILSFFHVLFSSMRYNGCMEFLIFALSSSLFISYFSSHWMLSTQ